MITSIMQPYFFPYLGYWQLINASSKFILFDDVNYIKKGFIDRNFIYSKDKPHRIKIRLTKASQNRPINAHQIMASPAELLPTIEQVYGKHAQYEAVLPLLKSILEYPETNLALFLENSIKVVCNYLSINTEIDRSSRFTIPACGKARIIPMVQGVGSSHYLNPEGGKHLYNALDFHAARLKLSFFRAQLPASTFPEADTSHPASIIDLMMRFDRQELGRLVSLGEVFEESAAI